MSENFNLKIKNYIIIHILKLFDNNFILNLIKDIFFNIYHQTFIQLGKINLNSRCMHEESRKQADGTCRVSDKVRTRYLTYNHAQSFHLYFRF